MTNVNIKENNEEKIVHCRRKIDEIIVHCTATKEGREVSVEDVRRWHVDGNGWNDIGYHYLIYLDGSVHEGRPIDKSGAHCVGHNSRSIGVCYVGGLDARGKAKDTRTPAQRQSLRELIRMLKRSFPTANVFGHRDFANKACPCFDARREYAEL